MKAMLLTLLAAAAALAALLPAKAPAQPFATPQRIVVEPTICPPAVAIHPIRVEAWTDRPSYFIGDSVGITVRVDRDAFVYIFSTSACGDTRRIFPNPWDRDNFLRRNRAYHLPGRGNYRFAADGPPGIDEIRVIAASERLPWMEQSYHRFDPRDPFPSFPCATGFELRYQQSFSTPSGHGSFGFSQRIVVQPHPQPVWIGYGETVRRVSIHPRHPVVVCPWSSPPRSSGFFHFSYQGGGSAHHPHAAPSPSTPWGHRAAPPSAHQPVRGHGSSPRTPSPRLGSFEVTSWPQGADVFVDGQHAGRTPLRLDVPEGRYDIRVQAPGYRPWSRTSTIRPGGSERYSVRLTR